MTWMHIATNVIECVAGVCALVVIISTWTQ
jgi:hypothetical protein